ncbi:S-adenosyl-L-methionine-dependent methyltransferase [Panaeolus papilionaceus]|nr:S-adenosyl-L-methionine-dependent methyltransferase [Panaeolus papilionaceus]
MPPPNIISALVDLITQSSKIVEAAYQTSDRPFVPSLDDTEPHPLDDKIWDKDVKKAIQTIEGACAQLCATLAKPDHTLMNKSLGYVEPTCINIILTHKIPDVLLQKPAGMHISEIEEKTGLEATKIGRILRVLATKYIFREVSENVFANNRLSIPFLSTNPLYNSTLNFTYESTKSGSFLCEVLGDKKWGHSFSPRETAFNKWSGYDGTLFEFYEGATPHAAELGDSFGIAMIAIGRCTEAEAVFDQYPWNQLGHGASVCDIGAGVGNILLHLARRHPTLQLVLQDLPERINQAKNEIWPERCPEAIAENRIRFEPLDFLTQSPVPGCHVYYLKNIIHDWPDLESVTILTGIRKVMAPHSRVLVHEFILHPVNRVPESEASYDQAPEPLLPNYGVGTVKQYYLDIDMMVAFNSQERQLSQFIKLGDAAGLKFQRVWDLGETGLVEYRLPQPGDGVAITSSQPAPPLIVN